MSAPKRKVVRSEGREIIAKVYHFMKSEAEHGVKCPTNARWRTAQATGVSEQTVSRILREEKSLPSTSSKFISPMSKRKRRLNKIDINSFQIRVVRRTIQTFHMEFKQLPTIRKMYQVLKDRIKFDGSISTMRRLLLKIGYKWRKTGNRKILTERHDIQMLRLKYLELMRQYRSEDRPIVYTDESCIYTDSVKGMTWGDEDDTPFTKKLSQSSRFIVVYAGTKEGFVPHTFLIYEAEMNTGDCNTNMSYENYEKWLTVKLLPHVPPKSVIIMNNAAYQNVRASKTPTPNSNKTELIKWLKDHNIIFGDTMKTVELYDLVKRNKERFSNFKIDDVIKSKGHDVLRLPPHHPELNAIENICGILKSNIAAKNVGKNVKSIKVLVQECVNMIDSTMWASTCSRVEEIEDEYTKYYDTDFGSLTNMQDDTEFTNVSDSDMSDCTSDDSS